MLIFSIFLMFSGVLCYSNDQPRIKAEKYNMVIRSAQNKNVSLISEKGIISANGKDIGKILKNAKKVLEKMGKFDFENIGELQSSVVKLREDLDSKVVSRIVRFEKYFGTPGNESSLSYLSRFMVSKFRKDIEQITTKLEQLLTAQKSLKTLTEKNECTSSPCQHGGTCFDTLQGFHCVCPENWQGQMCDIDVDECDLFRGTDLGCQNNSTCINSAGSYTCLCPTSNLFGLHCTKQTFDCTKDNSEEMCGHGYCINQGGNGNGFVCVCHQGWKSPGPGVIACVQDVNECNSKTPPCSQTPPVKCINTPGSFHCGECPPGYTGNGYQCTDIDECQTNNGGCSTNPKVQCINLRGYSLCGPCPPGYSGDGKVCEFVNNLCLNNNGGCNPLSTCIYNSGMNRVICKCPRGFSGTGIGPEGCVNTNKGNGQCDLSPCLNSGSCVQTISGYQCLCLPEYFGENCELVYTSCLNNPCKNGGSCRANNQSFDCLCAEGYSGRHCEIRENDCTDIFKNNNGTIYRRVKYLEYMKSRRVHLSCSWTVMAPNIGDVLNITFLELNFPGESLLCTDDDLSLRVYDGLAKNSKLVGKYCGGKLPKPYTSSHEAVKFVLQGLITSSAEFKVSWNTTKRNCDEVIKLKDRSSSTISSPGYPGHYPQNSDCRWIVIANGGERIQMLFSSLDIESTPNCTADYLEIRDGLGTSPTLARLCNSSIPPPIVTSSSYLYMTFHSDSDFQGTGFQLSFTKIPGIPGCGGHLTSPEGTIAIPNVPVYFTSSISVIYCSWIIHLPVEEKIKVYLNRISKSYEEISDFHLGAIKVFDGPDESSEILGSWNFDEPSEMDFTSSSNFMTISYTNYYDGTSAPGVIKYESVCGGVYTSESGALRSPYYPNNYPGKRTCRYLIKQPPGFAVILDFLDFDLELTNKQNENCAFDSVKVFDGYSENAPIKGTFCGKKIPKRIISTHNYLFLKFKTDESNHGRGFVANYTTVELDCGGIYTESNGTIQSKSTIGKVCSWIIAAPENQLIKLEWLEFRTRNDCNISFVEIHENGTSISQKNSGKKFCSVPPTLTSIGNVLMLTVHLVLFKVNYSFEIQNSCSERNFIASAGSIVSPDYPNSYPDNLNCTWTVTVPYGNQIRLVSKDFRLDFARQCTNDSDYLEIRNGGTPESPLIGRFCDANFFNEYTSHSNSLFIRFVTNAFSSSHGFKLEWDGFSDGCGGHMKTSSGEIISPNYPLPYGQNTDCIWKITTSSGTLVELTIEDIDLELNCTNDYLEIFDGKRKTNSLGTFCHMFFTEKIVLYSKSNYMLITFVSDIAKQGRGFKLTYRSICNRTITDYQGAIESPEFPSMSNLEQNCLWEIRAPRGNQIKIIFSHSSLGNCDFNKLQIAEGSQNSTETNVLIKNHCSEKNKTITSNLNHVFIRYTTQAKEDTDNLFRLEWQVIGCGGMFKNVDTYREFNSPSYPTAYKSPVVCEWYVSVEEGKGIEFVIHDLNIVSSKDCDQDSLTIYSGSDDSSPVESKLCGAIVVSSVKLYSNNAFVRYTSNNAANKGFRATLNTREEGCGAGHYSNSGKISSYGFPKNYSQHTDCIYQIIVSKSFRIRLNFTAFDIPSDINENNNGCSNSFLEVYEYGGKIQRFCNRNPPTVLTTSSHAISIELYSRQGPTGRGFLASYKAVCGGKISAEKKGRMFSPSSLLQYFSLMEDGENCTWVINSEEPSRKVTLMFTQLKLKTDESETYIKIYPAGNERSAAYKTVTGNKIPPPIVLPSSVVTISFAYRKRTYFNLDYSFLDTACGGLFISSEGKIVSPNYPNNYPSNTECAYTIRLSPGNSVSLRFLMMDIENSENCNEDYIEVREEDKVGKLIGFYCGSTLPDDIRSNSSIYIIFRSSENTTGRGFELEYSMEHGRVIRGPSGKIGSPSFPDLYDGSEPFTWRIVVGSTSIIQLSIHFYSIAAFYPDCLNGLKIFDGYNEDSYVLFQTCSTTNLNVTSKTNVLFIKSSFDGPSRFLLKWLEIGKSGIKKEEDNITRVFLSTKSDMYNFTSPGYPGGYDKNLDVAWIFETDPYNHITIQFLVLDLEKNSFFNDFIKIYNLEDPETAIATLSRPNDTWPVSAGSSVQVNFKTDYFGNGTGFQAKAFIECGGNITGSAGKIILPKFKTQLTCEWRIKVKPGRKIKISFTNFNIPTTRSTCSDGYVILKNGHHSDSPFLGAGKYCGRIAPSPLTTSSNYAYILFNQYSLDEKIEIFYEEESHFCDETYELSEGYNITISSPNYPNVPQPHTECQWIFITSPEKNIHFQFNGRFDLTVDKECVSEYLELHEGSSEVGKLIGKYCQDIPPFVVTNGNALFVKYVTDLDDPHDGFQATVSINKCGGTFYDKSKGKIESPNYPEPYERNMNCTWFIRGEPGTYYVLHVPRDTQMEKDDRLIVSEIDTNATPLKLTTEADDKEYELHSNVIKIELNSSPSQSESRKFLIEFFEKDPDCSRTLLDPTGIVTSPGYPKGSKAYCHWHILAPTGKRVTLNIVDFDMPKPEKSLHQNYLTVYNGFRLNKDDIMDDVKNGTVFKSLGFALGVVYDCNDCGTHRGFKAEYSTFEDAPCGGDLEGKNGTVDFEENSTNTFECEWRYSKEDRSTITFTFSGTIGLTKQKDCSSLQTKIEFRSGYVRNAFFCGYIPPDKPQTVSTSLKYSTISAIKFNKKSQGEPFDVKFSWKVDECGGSEDEPSFLMSPGFPNYYKSLNCVWNLRFSTWRTIKIKFDTFELDESCKDFLEIRNGNNPFKPRVGKFCGSKKLKEVVTTTKRLWIHFHSESSNQFKGFNISFENSMTDCGGILESRDGIFASPKFPLSYDNNLECEWEIVSSENSHLNLRFTSRFQIESSPGCVNDFVEISDFANNSWVPIRKVCGRESGEAINSTSNRVKVMFKTNEKTTGAGFQIKFKEECGGVFVASGEKKRLFSPGYPDSYKGPLLCNYTILAPSGKNIIANFTTFQLQDEVNMKNCSDYVDIEFVKILDFTKRKNRFCGNSLPPIVDSREILTIIFSADELRNGPGFELDYFLHDCVRKITTEDSITLPGQIGHSTLNCKWEIVAPKNMTVKILIRSMDLRMRNCRLNSLKIYEGTGLKNDTLIANLCNSIRGSVFKTKSNQATITFYSLLWFKEINLFATLNFLPGELQGCGGSISLEETRKKSISFSADKYNSGALLECFWTITAKVDETIKIKIIATTMKENLCLGQLAIYDGPNSNYDRLSAINCSYSIDPYITSQNVATIGAYTEGHSGFKFTVEVEPQRSECGNSVYTVGEIPRSLQSPNYPKNYPSNVNCVWTLKSSRDDTIAIHIEYLNIEESIHCQADRLMIEDSGKKTINLPDENAGYRITIGELIPRRNNNILSGTAIFCGENITDSYYSNSDLVQVKFKSNDQVTSKGFKLTYSTNTCDRSYYDQGRIYLKLKNVCQFVIFAPKNHTISLFIKMIGFTPGYIDCDLSFLNVFEGLKPTENGTIKTTCENNMISPIYSVGPILTLQVKKDSRQMFSINKIFDATFTSTGQGQGCGGKLTGNSGVFTSPFYPNNFRKNSTCEWTISVPLGNLPVVKFEVFDIGTKETCPTNFVNIYEVKDEKILMQKFCGEDKPGQYHGHTRTIVIAYVTTQNNGGTGFVANYHAIVDENVLPGSSDGVMISL